jgi:hypothetical protein
VIGGDHSTYSFGLKGAPAQPISASTGTKAARGTAVSGQLRAPAVGPKAVTGRPPVVAPLGRATLQRENRSLQSRDPRPKGKAAPVKGKSTRPHLAPVRPNLQEVSRSEEIYQHQQPTTGGRGTILSLPWVLLCAALLSTSAGTAAATEGGAYQNFRAAPAADRAYGAVMTAVEGPLEVPITAAEIRSKPGRERATGAAHARRQYIPNKQGSAVGCSLRAARQRDQTRVRGV